MTEALAPWGRQLKTHSARAATSAGLRSSNRRSSRPVSEGWIMAMGGWPSCRLVTATISASS